MLYICALDSEQTAAWKGGLAGLAGRWAPKGMNFLVVLFGKSPITVSKVHLSLSISVLESGGSIRMVCGYQAVVPALNIHKREAYTTNELT